MPSSRSTDTFPEFIMKQMAAWGGAMALPDADIGLISATMSSLRDYMTKPQQDMAQQGLTNAPAPPGSPGGMPGGMGGAPGPAPAAPGMGMGASLPIPGPDASQNPGMSDAVQRLLSQGVQGGGQ